MEYIGEDGRVITDEMFEQWGERIEREGLSGTRGGELVTRREQGRPRLFDEPLVPTTTRLRPAQLASMERHIEVGDGGSQAELLRTAYDYWDAHHPVLV